MAAAMADEAKTEADAASDSPRDSTAPDAQVIFLPSGRRGRFARGTKLLDAARQLGVYVESVCGGRGICGRCQISPVEGHFAKHGFESRLSHVSEMNAVERRYVELRALGVGRRLSCQTLIDGDIVVDVPADAAVNRQLVRKRAEARIIDRDPAVQLHYVELDPPSMECPLGEADRIAERLRHDIGLAPIRFEPSLLQGLQATLQSAGHKVTAVVHVDTHEPARLIDIRPGASDTLYGVAIDIGSTTIACHLVDLTSGRTIGSAGTANPQIRFGEDLMSRVSYVMMNPGGLGELSTVVRAACNDLIGRVVAEGGCAAGDVLEIAVVANPIMHHLLLGVDPTPLGSAPFALAVSGALRLLASDIGLNIHPAGRAYVLPCVAGHVGADAAGVLLAEGPQHHDETTLVVDVGTNAEIMLGNRERVLAASSPTGPAFEGAEISCGQRAAPGAIERVRIDPQTLEPKVRVIGCDSWSDEPGFAAGTEASGVTGLCGSGIVEAIAEMYLSGVISEDGVIDGALAARSDRIVPEGRTASYILWRGSQELRIRQNDVRAIQLAKAALYAGSRLLMDRLGVEQVDRIKLAGAFGSYIDPKYAMILGMIPDCDLAAVTSIGNAAATGARMALLNRGHRREVEAIVTRVEKIETALEARFQQHFVNAMALPNKSDPFPRLACEVDLPARETAGRSGRPRRRTRTDRTADLPP
ncbi:MAG: DUF4445 domain-containing protein [Rhizobiales bacterium]|nr:DUF4445 domain-containing protein [Hyphomicrobiales bacterium]